jgi:predicted TPR repeat methyltransferase
VNPERHRVLQQAVALHQSGQLAEAAALYRNLLAKDLRDAKVLHLLGVLESQRGNSALGLELIDRAIAIEPNSAMFWFNRGNTLRHLRRLEDALASYGRASAIKSGYAEALYNSGATLQDLKRFDEALAIYDRALKVNPDSSEALNNRGVVLAELKRFDEAIASYERALQIKRDHVEALNNRGNALQALKRFDDALISYDRALAIKPDYHSALINRGAALHALKRFADELAHYDRMLSVKPDSAEALNGRGMALRELNRLEEALESFDKALAKRPGWTIAALNRETTLLSLGRLSRVPPSSVVAIFDEFSSHYDDTMLVKLGYRGHVHVRTLAERVLPRLNPPWRILDLGTGTGLVGAAFKDLAVGGRLDGIDLSPLMIEAARARNVYDDLILGDLETVLAEPGRSYDLILSADTMIYIGDLAPTFAGVVKRLVPGGFYIFACESKSGDGWDLSKVHRFRHSESYIRAQARRAGLDFVDSMECFLRTEADEPVPGMTVALRTPERDVTPT